MIDYIFPPNKYQRKLQDLYSWSASVVFASSVGFSHLPIEQLTPKANKRKTPKKLAAMGF